ncbi:MAG: hypothetical protein JWP12_672 [Bacteroidetes bacterium]|nr:hypothetical protein [Bacteroidota bacterium]
MNKQQIIESLQSKYHSFIDYINSLSTGEYVYSYQQKWTAGQQLEHIVLCVKPIVQVFSMDAAAIEKNFGSTDRISSTYEALLQEYTEKLKEGGKAPSRYVPESSLPDREVLTETLAKLIAELNSKIENFTEQELNRLCIPHPLLGNLTLREMLYNVIYHVQHHQEITFQNLKNK